jgi:hypothetical protein
MNIETLATLEQYVENKNKWRAIFNQAPLSLLNAQDRQSIADSIDSEMSPENLTCDGELPASVVRAKMRNLTRCAEELLSIDPSVTFSEMRV